MTAAALSGLLVVSTLAATPAQAAKPPARTAISAHLAPATALVRSSAVVSGTVSPKGGSVVLQRLVGKKWQPLAHSKPSTTGAFSFSVRTPRAAATWRLRVTRAAARTTRTGVSNSLTLHVVPTAYLVAAAAAPVTAPAPLVVTGSVAPRATGPVQLQLLSGATWTTIATATLTPTSGFSVTTVLPAGSAQLRVVKPFTTKVAAGTSPSFDVSVQPAVAAPTITTTVLPQARVGQPYLTALTAAGGTGPYAWSVAGLPTGLALSPTGILSGTPLSRGSTSFTATVTDAGGRSVTATLALAVAAPAGRLFSAGAGVNALLGNGATTDSKTIVPVIGQSAATSVASDDQGAVAADADGSVWAWGDNLFGELGESSPPSTLVPVHVVGLTNVTEVTASEGSRLALRADGTVWSWGYNGSGRLGDGTTTTRPTPAQVTGLTSAIAIASGGASSYALRSDGTVWAWGFNGEGELGDGTTTMRLTPTQIPGLTGITAIAAAQRSAYALRTDGSVLSWGDNMTGQLGDGTTTPRTTPVHVSALAGVTAIAAGRATAYALTASGTVSAWGDGQFDALGNGTTTTSSTPVGVLDLAGVTAISGAGNDALALLPDGTVWGWGWDGSGELGNNTQAQQPQPVAMLGVTGAVALGSGATGISCYVIAN